MKNNASAVVIGILAIGGLIALVLFSGGNQERRVDRSLIGVNGLGVWLQDAEVPLRMANPRRRPVREELGLRILPLFDTDLDNYSQQPESRQDLIRQTTQRDMPAWVFRGKLVHLETLVLLPKWTSGMVATRVAHEQTLIPLVEMNRLVGQTPLSGANLVRPKSGMVEIDLKIDALPDAYKIALFQPQVFDPRRLPDACTPVADTSWGALIVRCAAEGERKEAIYLSDPDLMNNHGLSIGENAQFALDYISLLHEEGTGYPIYLDSLAELRTVSNEHRDEREDYDQGWEEFARYFSYPFSVFWAVLTMILSVAFWRGSRRFGPVAAPREDRLEYSKSAAIAAKARLLRLSGNDGKMAVHFVRVRLKDIATRIFGPDLGQAGQDRLFTYLARRDADLAENFRTCSDALIERGATMSPGELSRHLKQFNILCEKVK